jgi:hypothetical protein
MDKSSKKYYTTKGFLNKETVEKHRSDYIVFFTFFVISAFFWLLISLSQEYSVSYDMRVYLQSPPKSKLITKQVDSTVTFNITAQGFYLLKLEFMHPDELIINVKDYTLHKIENNIYYISTQPLKENIAKLLNVSPSKIGFSKNTLSFYLATLQSKKVEVVPRLTLKFADFFNLYKPYTVNPEKVIAYGPKEILDTLDRVYTVPVTLNNIKESLEVSMKIENSTKSLLTFEPDHVKVILEVAKFTQSSVVVPVTNDNINVNIHTFPSKIKIYYNVALKDFDKVKSSDFTVVPNVDGVNLRKVSMLDLKVLRKPSYVRNILLEPSQVEFIIVK